MPRPEEDSLHTNYRPYLHLECRLVAPPTQSVRRAAAALAFLSSNFFHLNLPCIQSLAVFTSLVRTPSMLLLNRVRSCAHRNLPNPNLLASKRCFSGGADTSGGLETLRQLSGLLTDGGRRKKREIDFAIPKHIGIRARVEYGFQRIKHRIGERGAIQRRQLRRCGSNHWRPPRNRVRENPETRPAKSPRAPAAATPSYHPVLTPQVSRFWWGRPPGLRATPGRAAATTKPVEMPAPF